MANIKNSWEWTESDILEMIKNKTPESLHLDYKRIDALSKTDSKKNELSKDVSAFANSDGGILIYGVVDEDNSPTEIDKGVHPDKISKEWIEQVINSRIQRRIPDIRITAINLSNPSDHVIYVIDIPKSNFAPHMAGNKKYYKRFNFESVAMEEYEVRDVSNRYNVPDLHLECYLRNYELNFEPNNSYSGLLECNFILGNSSSVPAEYTIIQMNVDKRILLNNINGYTESGETNVYNETSKQNIVLSSYYKHYTPQHFMPILYGFNFDPLNGNPLLIRLPITPGTYFITVKLISARMVPKTYIFSLSHDGEKVKVDSNSFKEHNANKIS